MTLKTDDVVQVLLRGRLRIAAIAVAILRDAHAAEDVFQQVVMSALEHAETFRDEAHVVAWAVRAARFRAVDTARKRRMAILPDDVLGTLEAQWSDPDVDDPAGRLSRMHECFDRLTARSKDLLHMRYEERLSVLAMSRRLGKSGDAMYQALSRIHRVLRECVGRDVPAETVVGGDCV